MTTTLSIPYGALIRKVDPDFNRHKRRELEYRFTRREFYGLYDERGPYAEVFLATDDGQLLMTDDGRYLLSEPMMPADALSIPVTIDSTTVTIDETNVTIDQA